MVETVANEPVSPLPCPTTSRKSLHMLHVSAASLPQSPLLQQHAAQLHCRRDLWRHHHGLGINSYGLWLGNERACTREWAQSHIIHFRKRKPHPCDQLFLGMLLGPAGDYTKTIDLAKPCRDLLSEAACCWAWLGLGIEVFLFVD